jgi:ribosomal-protein-alanine N-acetyltransferase
LNDLRLLERICFPHDAWPLLDLVGVLTLPSVVRLKAAAPGLMVGFIAGDVRQRQHIAWIATIAVLPEHRGRGIGRALLEACEARLDVPRVRLCLRASNRVAEQLYLSSGYQHAGRWTRYYQDGEDALVMEKAL